MDDCGSVQLLPQADTGLSSEHMAPGFAHHDQDLARIPSAIFLDGMVPATQLMAKGP